MVTEAGVWFDGREICSEMGARSLCSGGWMLVKGVDFGEGADFFAAVVRGKGEIEIRLDKAGNRASAVISVDSPDYAENCVPFVGDVCGVHDVFIIFGQSDLCLKKWKVK